MSGQEAPENHATSQGFLRKILVRGGFHSFILQGAGVGFAFAASIVLARVLGPDEFGVYSYSLAWLYILFLFARLGLDDVLLRFVPRYVVREEWGLLRGLLRRTSQFAFGMGAAIGLAFFVVVRLSEHRMDPGLRDTFYVACLVPGVMALSQLRQAALRGMFRVAWGQLPEMVIRPLVLALLVGVLGVAVAPLSAAEGMMCLLTAALVAFGVGAVVLRRVSPSEIRSARAEFATRTWLTTAVPLMLISGLQLAMSNIDTMMVGTLVDTTDAGFYRVANRVGRLAIFGMSAVLVVVNPLFARVHASDDAEQLQRVVRSATLGCIGVTVPIATTLFFIGPFILRFFGPEFVVGADVLRITAATQVLIAITGPIGGLLMMTGRHNLVLALVAVSTISDIVLNALLIPRYGMEGAAIATSVSLLAGNITMVALAPKFLGVRASLFSLRRQRPTLPSNDESDAG